MIRWLLLGVVLAIAACGDKAPENPPQKIQIVLRIGEQLMVLDKGTVDSATLVTDCPAQPGSACLLVKMTPVGKTAFADLTSKNVGKSVDVIVNGEVVTRPVIREAITGGQTMLSNIPRKQAERFIESFR